MAVTTQYSSEYNIANVAKTGNLNPDELRGRVRVAHFEHTQSGLGDAGSSVALVKLPAGRIRILGRQSGAYVNWTTASARMDIGTDAYIDQNGNAVAAEPKAIDSLINVDTAGFQTFGSALTSGGGSLVIESQDGVTIRATSATAIADADVLKGDILYVVD